MGVGVSTYEGEDYEVSQQRRLSRTNSCLSLDEDKFSPSEKVFDTKRQNSSLSSGQRDSEGARMSRKRSKFNEVKLKEENEKAKEKDKDKDSQLSKKSRGKVNSDIKTFQDLMPKPTKSMPNLEPKFPEPLGNRTNSSPARLSSRRISKLNMRRMERARSSQSQKKVRRVGIPKKKKNIVRRLSFVRNRQAFSQISEISDMYKHNQVDIDFDEVRAISEATSSELAKYGYTLREWEEIYKALSSFYEVNFNSERRVSFTSGISKYCVENALNRISRFIENHPEYKEKQAAKWTYWDLYNESKNKRALQQMKSFVPSDIKNLSAKDIVEEEGRSWPLARRLVETKIFQLLYMPLGDIKKIHNADFSLQGRFDYSILDIVELRAVYYATKRAGNMKWRRQMRELLYEYTIREENDTLSETIKRNKVYTYRGSKTGSEFQQQKNDETQRLTSILRAKTKCLFSDLGAKSEGKRQKMLNRVEEMTNSSSNKYTRMVRTRLSIVDPETQNKNELDDDDDDNDLSQTEKQQCFDNFYTHGSFGLLPDQERKEDSDSDEDELETIEQLIKDLSKRVKSPEELERLLSTVFE